MADRRKNSAVFREKSLDKVASPENLDSYIRSTTPSLWLALGAVIILLVGVIIWGIFGKLDSASTVGCTVENGVITVYIKEIEAEKLSEGSYIEIDGLRYGIASVKGPTLVSAASDVFLLQAAEIGDSEWYYELTGSTDLADGQYKGRVVYEKISPITFIIN